MKSVLFVLCAFALAGLAGCGKFDRAVSAWTGQPSEVCVSGVTYLQFTSGATVKVDVNGKPVTCK